MKPAHIKAHATGPTGRSHSWMVDLRGGAETVDLAAVTGALAQQESNAVALAGGELLQTFYGVGAA